MRQALTKAGVVGLLWLSVTRTACVNVLGSRSQSLYQTWKGLHVASTREGVQSTIRAPSHLCLVSSGRLASSQVTFAMLCLVTQSCRTLFDLMDYSLPGTSVHGDSPWKNIEIGCHALLQEIFPTQGSNPCLPHCRWILYHLSHQGSPFHLVNA